ncbi:hypothetical protein BT93_E2068 [Corymbia citriodora subsp. variegata]|nr:hypothetical protein BT93_E2068 [Corymbia citriodora subsp. variegata]
MDGMELVSSRLEVLWEEWELRVLILLSLAIQVLLIVLGHHRKCQPATWLKVLVWPCYLLADVVAIYGLGKIAIRIKHMRRQLGANELLGPDAQMAAFWTPFLLLHLGGPDTITAYALEDNELWLRHLLQLVVQALGTLLVFFQASTVSDLSLLSLLMFVSGLIKYSERVYVLWAGSSEHFRDSIPDLPLRYSKILEEYQLKEAEGYDITPYEVNELRGVNVEPNSEANLSSPDEVLLSDKLRKHKQGEGKSNGGQSLLAAARGPLYFFQRLFGDRELLPIAMSKRNRAELAVAKDLIKIFQRLFADLMLSFQDHKTSLLILKDKHFHVVFRVIEIELGFMYDLLYTKVMAIHNRWGFALRTMSILLTSMVLVLFSLSNKDKYSKIDTHVTFLLLWIAIFLESYGVFVILFSDKAACWLKNHRPTFLDFVERFQPLYNRRRWSGFMAQHNLLSFALKEKHPVCHPILELLGVDEKVLKHWYKGHVKVSDFLKERVIEHVKSLGIREKEVPSVWTFRGDLILGRYKLLDDFQWSIELDFDQSILIWHIATELAYHREDLKTNASKMSMQLSRYMLYLLVMYPFLMPIGVARVRFQDMFAEAKSFFSEQKSVMKTRPKTHSDGENEADSEADIAKACDLLHDNVNTQLALTVAKGEKSKFTLYHGCRLASQLGKLGDHEKAWDIISFVWVEMLAYTAIKCKGFHHAQQLRQGGEFLTHVWLLMAHFGLTDHFQIPHAPVIAELLVEQE